MINDQIKSNQILYCQRDSHTNYIIVKSIQWAMKMSANKGRHRQINIGLSTNFTKLEGESYV